MELPRRKKLRLEGYDYSRNGAYFITICTKGRQCLFGEVGRDSSTLAFLQDNGFERMRDFLLAGILSRSYYPK